MASTAAKSRSRSQRLTTSGHRPLSTYGPMIGSQNYIGQSESSGRRPSFAKDSEITPKTPTTYDREITRRRNGKITERPESPHDAIVFKSAGENHRGNEEPDEQTISKEHEQFLEDFRTYWKKLGCEGEQQVPIPGVERKTVRNELELSLNRKYEQEEPGQEEEKFRLENEDENETDEDEHERKYKETTLGTPPEEDREDQQRKEPEEVDPIGYFVEKSKFKKHIDKEGLDGTILHVIIKHAKFADERWWEGLKNLFSWIMQEFQDLYKDDEPTQTVLMVAIRHEAPKAGTARRKPIKPKFIPFFIKSFPEQTAHLIMKIDASQAGAGAPLIHQLLPYMIESDCAGPIFQHLDKTTLIQKDKYRNTILHITASFAKLSDAAENQGLQSGADEERSQAELEKRLRLIKDVLSRCPEVLTEVNGEGESPYTYRLKTASNAPNARVLDDDELQGGNTEPVILGVNKELQPLYNDPIAAFLKNKIMHLNNRDQIIRSLHGPVQERHVDFDLLELGPNPAVSTKDLIQLVNSIKFESILRYVRVPRYTPSTESHSQNDEMADQRIIGRGGAKLIFDLLRIRGVRKIITVIVIDDGEVPHRDEVIEDLEHFDVEELDWRKVDLCSSVILKAAKNATKLFLYSSGNKAVLRSWSGSDGLNQLRLLKEVTVLIRSRFESEAKMKEYLKDFESRMSRNCSNVIIESHIQASSGLTNDQQWFPGADKQEMNAWLKNMDKFVEFIKNIPLDVTNGREVRVAVIDDGIDMIKGGFGKSISDGVSFHTGGQLDKTLPYWFSSSGHGTLMATLIRRLCPHAKLYIARIEHGLQTGQPTVESAIKGIEWAVKKRVHIISMSWTFAQLSQDEHSKMEKAISDARRGKILMFAAVDDQGLNKSSLSYPGAFTGVIRIGAAKQSGHASDAEGDKSHFVFPGASIGIKSLHSPSEDSHSIGETASGSSFATAVASGFAALILFCVELCDQQGDVRKDIQNYQNMRAIFEEMAKKSQGNRYVQVLKYFLVKNDDYEWEEDGEEALRDALVGILRGYEEVSPENKDKLKKMYTEPARSDF